MMSGRAYLQVEQLESRDAPSGFGGGSDSHKIHTTIDGHLTSATSTVGTIQSGLLRGTTQFSGTFTDAQGDYVGTLVITTKHGTLTLQDQGNLNATTGQFTDHLTVSSGTGRFAGATGHLFDQGVINLQTGSFTDVPLTGEICLHNGHGN
jgi:hypothetical protein